MSRLVPSGYKEACEEFFTKYEEASFEQLYNYINHKLNLTSSDNYAIDLNLLAGIVSNLQESHQVTVDQDFIRVNLPHKKVSIDGAFKIANLNHVRHSRYLENPSEG